MTHRLLPREEWDKLEGTGLEQLTPYLPPEAWILVVEEGSDIVAAWSAFPRWHFEGIWIAPPYRGRAGRHLLVGMREEAGERGIERVLTAAVDEQVEEYLERIGAEALPGTHYVWPLGKES